MAPKAFVSKMEENSAKDKESEDKVKYLSEQADKTYREIKEAL